MKNNKFKLKGYGIGIAIDMNGEVNEITMSYSFGETTSVVRLKCNMSVDSGLSIEGRRITVQGYIQSTVGGPPELVVTKIKIKEICDYMQDRLNRKSTKED